MTSSCRLRREVYREFTYGGEHLTSALQYKGYEQNVIVIDSISKRFSACGARVGMVISKNKGLHGSGAQMVPVPPVLGNSRAGRRG